MYGRYFITRNLVFCQFQEEKNEINFTLKYFFQSSLQENLDKMPALGKSCPSLLFYLDYPSLQSVLSTWEAQAYMLRVGDSYSPQLLPSYSPPTTPKLLPNYSPTQGTRPPAGSARPASSRCGRTWYECILDCRSSVVQSVQNKSNRFSTESTLGLGRTRTAWRAATATPDSKCQSRSEIGQQLFLKQSVEADFS